jgi:hypothetical protein
MHSFLVVSLVYMVGCILAMAFFMFGRSPTLIEHNHPWPIIFLWPLVVYWPVHALAGFFIKWKTSQPKMANQPVIAEIGKQV